MNPAEPAPEMVQHTLLDLVQFPAPMEPLQQVLP
jgi:hypothetical protein